MVDKIQAYRICCIRVSSQRNLQPWLFFWVGMGWCTCLNRCPSKQQENWERWSIGPVHSCMSPQWDYLLSHFSLKPWSMSKLWVWSFFAGIIYINECTGRHTHSSGKGRAFPAGPIYGDIPVPRAAVLFSKFYWWTASKPWSRPQLHKQPNKLC